MKRAAFLAGMTVALLAVFGPHPSKAMVGTAGSVADVADLTDIQVVAKKFKGGGGGGGGGKGNANRKGGGGGNKNANRNNNNNKNANRNNNNKNNNKNNNNKNNKNNNNNKNKNKNVNVNVHVRGWARRPYYGTIVGGVAIGTIIAASTVPVAPASGLCWYWTDGSQTRGYWDYCS